MHGNVDHEGNLNARFNQAWTEKNTTKLQGSVRMRSQTAIDMF